MRPLILAAIPLSLLLAACGGTSQYKTVNVTTPNGTYEEHVGITATQPTHNPDGTPYVPPTYVRRPVTIYSPNSAPATVDLQQEK